MKKRAKVQTPIDRLLIAVFGLLSILLSFAWVMSGVFGMGHFLGWMFALNEMANVPVLGIFALISTVLWVICAVWIFDLAGESK